jgi:F420-dependent oxidoreductase-like protein
MRIGLNVANFAVPGGPAALGPALAATARYAEASGFDSLWVWDHLFWDDLPTGPDVTDRPMLEAYTTLGFIACATSAIPIGTLVTGVTYRHPGVLVKQMTTLDVLSGGRAWFGIGAAWFEEEHLALGVPFPPQRERFEQLEEAVQIALQMWADEGQYDRARPYAGRSFQLARALNVPQAIQRPHPPILIGGNGERTTLRLVARYADACNLLEPLAPEALSHKLAVLRAYCEQLGRPYEAIEKTVYRRMRVTRDGRDGSHSPQQAIDYFGTLAALGFDAAMVCDDRLNLADPGELDIWAADVLPAVRTIAVAGR